MLCALNLISAFLLSLIDCKDSYVGIIAGVIVSVFVVFVKAGGILGIRTSRDLEISVLNICDISVLGTGHFGTE